jgi:ArsR family transcriptional regulator
MYKTSVPGVELIRVCFLVPQNAGLESPVFKHFGCAPAFVVIVTASDMIASIANRGRRHAYGACNPIEGAGQLKDRCRGDWRHRRRALSRLGRAGIKVYRAQSRNRPGEPGVYKDIALAEYALQMCLRQS